MAERSTAERLEAMQLTRGHSKRWLYRGAVALTLAALAAAPILLFLNSLGAAQYLPPDAGHYLADADALFGRGVREVKHPPLVPLLIGLVRLPVKESLASTRIVIILLVAALTLCFFIFIRGRTGSTIGDLVATAFFGLAPTTADAVGWFGASTLLGIALTLLALRWVADSTNTQSISMGLLAAAAVAFVVLTHPFTSAVLAETIGLYVLLRLAGSLIGRHSLERRKLLREITILAMLPAAAIAAFAVDHEFYGRIQNPLTIVATVDQLALVWTWAFRDYPSLWLGLLGLSCMAIPLGRWANGSIGRDLGVMVFALLIALVANIVFLSGDTQYVTRSMYFAPALAGATLGLVVTGSIRSIQRPSRRFRPLAAGAITVAIVLAEGTAFAGFAERLAIVLPYYTKIDNQELAAVDYLNGRQGTVVVAAKGDNLNGGTQYSWIIEGVARARAIGVGTFANDLWPGEGPEILDSERLVAGPTTVENGSVRVAFAGTIPSRIRIFGNSGGTWYPLGEMYADGVSRPLTPAILSEAVDGGTAEMASTAAKGAEGAVVSIDKKGTVTIAVPASQLGPNGQLDIVPAGVFLCEAQCVSTPVAPVQQFGTGVKWNSALQGRPVEVTIQSKDVATGRVARYLNNKGAGLRALYHDQPINVTVSISGLSSTQGNNMAFSQAQILRKQSVRYVWTWTSNQNLDELALRDCFALAFQNQEVAIFQIDPNCSSPASVSDASTRQPLVSKRGASLG